MCVCVCECGGRAAITNITSGYLSVIGSKGVFIFFHIFIHDFCTAHSVQSSSVAQSDSATPWTAAHQASLSITNSWSLLKFISIELVMPSNHLLCCLLLLLPSIFPSITVFFKESVLCIRWPTYWSFSFNISPSNEYSGLNSFRMVWLDLAVQGAL